MARKTRSHMPWTAREDRYILRHYADEDTAEIAAKLNRTIHGVQDRAGRLGVRKSAAYKSEYSKRGCSHPASIATRFTNGNVPPNKGKSWYQFMSEDAYERVKKTQFKPGCTVTSRPVGYERIERGYVLIKVEGNSHMVFKHVWVWEQHHGKRPAGSVIMFRDGNRLNCDIDNLELLTRSEFSRRRMLALPPEQWEERQRKMQHSRAETIRKDKMRIRWGLEPKTKLVKKWYAPQTL